MERFDAIVVGAGPAGSSTAIHLARGGARVLLLDRARFPRDKPCGGGLTGRALRHAPCDVSPVVEHDVDRFVVRVGYRRRAERRADSTVIRMTQRRRLDLHLVEGAAAAGADFRDGVRAAEIALDEDGVTVAAERLGAQSRPDAAFRINAKQSFKRVRIGDARRCDQASSLSRLHASECDVIAVNVSCASAHRARR